MIILHNAYRKRAYLCVRSGSWMKCVCIFATKTMAVRYFTVQKYQTLMAIFSHLCNCFAWGATDSNKVSFYLSIHVTIM